MPPVEQDAGGGEDERPVSIASLRSKFENMASESKGLREPPRSPAARRPLSRNGAEKGDVEGVTEGQAHSAGIARVQMGQAIAPAEGRLSAQPGAGNGVLVQEQTTLSPPPPTLSRTPSSVRRKPVPHDESLLSPQPLVPSASAKAATSPTWSATSTPMRQAATSPIPSPSTKLPPPRPQPLTARPGASAPTSPTPGLVDAPVQRPDDDDDTHAPSVSALRARFGGATGSRPTSPAPPAKPPPSAYKPPPPIPVDIRAPRSGNDSEGDAAAVFVDEPEVEEFMARRGSAISINQIDTDGTSTSVPLSPAPRAPPARRPSGPRKQSSTSSRGSASGSSPEKTESKPLPRRPPPPVVRRPSPAPPDSGGAALDLPPPSKPGDEPRIGSRSASPASMPRSPAAPENGKTPSNRAPPPPPPSRPGASQVSERTDTPDSLINVAADGPTQPSRALAPSAPPSLPARKPSLPVEPSGPPLIPPNRPSPTASSLGETSRPALPPPALPSRPRGDTVTQPPVSGGPPQLPSRSDTAPATLPPPPTRATPQASPLARATSVRRAVPQEAPYPARAGLSRKPTLPLPARKATLSTSPNDDYQPPPPPTRSVGAGDPVTSIPPSRRESKLIDLDSDEDEGEDETVQAQAITSSAKRLLEEYPDSTTANRRPPRFVPDIRISGTAHLSSFAVHGRHVCTGTQAVKVYDTFMSDQPILTVDLRETGLDFRVKENRITAMCFRPTKYESESGRYLWCGTKDGHLWELDIKTGQVTDTRAFEHSSAVVHIFRYKRWIMSLEEAGKLRVFRVGERDSNGASEGVKHIPALCKTLRVQERFNFAKLICGRLWTSSGPVNRSTTNAASKGPTIRVYDPCSEAATTTLSGGKTAWTTEWTGAVTSATILPLHPNTVYLGHEGGFVSVWDAEELVCTQVLKISPNDIMALEGVGERLWAGSRKGVISVFDVSEKPWRTTNTWLAHPEHPLSELVVDPYSVHDSGRFVLWSLARDALRAWDGLLSVDWVDQQMLVRQPDYCTFRDIKTLICSWNIDSAKPGDLSGTDDNINFFPDMLGRVDRPEIIVFGFQEVIPLTDKKLTAKTLLFGGKGKDSTVSADKISHAYRQWLDKLQMTVHAAYPDTQYVKVHSESLVGLFTCVFVKADERDILRDVEVTTVKRGIGGIYGNKGAILARLVIDDSSVCFINVHLAAGQSAKAARTADLAAIMEDKAVFSASDALPYIRGGDGTAISDHELVFLNGDLNYRIDQRRENVLASVAAGDLQYLLEHDQLRKEMRSNHAFRLRSFDEAPINFKPTYKYNRGEVEYDSSEKKRIPAWCDRILYSKSPRIQCLHYDRYEPTVSDHRPISAAFKLQVKAVDWERMKHTREEVRGQWAKREADVLGKIEGAYADLL